MVKSKIIVKNAIPEDFEFFLRLKKELWPWKMFVKKREYKKFIQDLKKSVNILIAKKDKKALGLMILRPKMLGLCLWLQILVITKKSRKKGVGSTLLKRAIAIAKKENYKLIFLSTRHNRKGAQRFYAKHGFKRINCFTVLFYKWVA